MKLKFHSTGFLLFLFLLFQIAIAQSEVDGTNFKLRGPATIIITVGELTEAKIEIFNKGSVAESYTIAMTASSPVAIEITNPFITTQTVQPGQTISIYSNIRALTEEDNTLSTSVTSSITLETKTLNIPVRTKKYSLPEFGLFGFLQIIAIAAVMYFLIVSRIK